jgi:hypothetical protein
MTRTAVTLAVVAALVLAGCGGGGGGGTTTAPQADEDPTPGDGTGDAPDGTPGATATPPAGTTAPPGATTTPGDGPPSGETTAPPETATPRDPSEIDLPPGIDESGVVDAATLAEAHDDYLSLRSGRQYLGWQRPDTGERRLWILDRGPVGTAFEIRSGENTTRYWSDGASVTYELENDDSGVLDRAVATGPTALRSTFAGNVDAAGEELRTYLRIGDWDVAGRTVYEGRAVVELEITDIDVAAVSETGFEEGDRDLTDFSGVAYVTEDGLIAGMEVDAEFTTGPANEQYTERFRASVTNVGSISADRPGWYDQAPYVGASYVADGRALELTHRAGAALPWTTELAVFREGSSTRDGVVEVPESIREGESLYVYAVSEQGDLVWEITTDPAEIPDDAIQLSDRGGIRVEATVDGITVVYATDAEE